MPDLTAALAGDRAVFERGDGLDDIENVIASDKSETVDHCPPLKSGREAGGIALAHKKSGARVWVRHHAAPNSITPYRHDED